MTFFWSLALIPTIANLVITWSRNPQSRLRSDPFLGSLSSGCFVLGSLSSPGSPSWVRGCDSFVGLLLAVPAAWPVFGLLVWVASCCCPFCWMFSCLLRWWLGPVGRLVSCSMFAVGVSSLSSGCFVLGSLSSPGSLLGSMAEIALLVCCLRFLLPGEIIYLLGLLLLASNSLGLVASWLPSAVVVFGCRLLVCFWVLLVVAGHEEWSVAWLPSCRDLMLLWTWVRLSPHMLRLLVRYCYYAAASAGLVCWCGWPVDEVFLHCCSPSFVSRGSYWLDHGSTCATTLLGWKEFCLLFAGRCFFVMLLWGSLFPLIRLFKGFYSLYFLFCKLVLLWFVQGSLFPLPGFVCPFCIASFQLVLLFLIYTILTFDIYIKKDWDLIPESRKRSDRSVTQWKPAPRHQHYWIE